MINFLMVNVKGGCLDSPAEIFSIDMMNYPGEKKVNHCIKNWTFSLKKTSHQAVCAFPPLMIFYFYTNHVSVRCFGVFYDVDTIG